MWLSCSSSPDSPFSLMSSNHLLLGLPLFLLPSVLCTSISITLLSSHHMDAHRAYHLNLLSWNFFRFITLSLSPYYFIHSHDNCLVKSLVLTSINMNTLL